MRHSPASPLVALGLTALLALTGTLPASAAPGEWSVPVTVSEAGGGAFAPQVVTDGSTITAIWSRFDGSAQRVQVSSSADDGRTWSAPVTVSAANGDAVLPQLVRNGSTITATWYRFDGTHDRVQVSSSADGGRTWGVPVTVSESGRDAYAPQLVTDGSTITVTWYRLDGSHERVQVSSSVDGGVTWSTPVDLSGAGGDAVFPQLVTDGSTITATWVRFDGSADRIQVSSSVNGGSAWSTPVDLAVAGSEFFGSAFVPQLVTDGSTITATWSDDDRVQVSSSVNRGVTWSAPVAVSEAGGNASDPQLVTGGSTITATWVGSADGDDRVQVSSSVNRGVTWSAPVAVSEAGRNASDPQLVTDGSTITATWSRSDGSHNRVQVSSSVNGGVTWSAPVDLAGAGGDAIFPQLVTDGSTITATWSRFDGSHNRVQVSSMVTPDDEPAGPETPESSLAEPELAATGANNSLVLGLLGAGVMLAGGVLVTIWVHRRRSA